MAIDYQAVYQANSFREFDDSFTALVNGFVDAEQYWDKCSSKQYLHQIETPTIIINALNDPFLPESCYPRVECEANKNLELLAPKYGGHVGFVKEIDGLNYYQAKILNFFDPVNTR